MNNYNPKGYYIEFSLLFVQLHYTLGELFWMRIFGVGFQIRSLKKFPLLFSEREGYWKLWQFGNYMIKYLPKSKVVGDE